MKAYFTGWVSDRSEFYLSTNERSEKYFDLTRYQTADYSRQMVFRNDRKWAISAISDDGRWLAIYVQAWRHNLSTEGKEKVVERDWDVTFLSFSSDGRYSVTGTNADASTKIEIVETASGEILALPELPAGDMAGVNFSNDSKTVAFYINADNTPANLYVYHIDSKRLRQLTNRTR